MLKAKTNKTTLIIQKPKINMLRCFNKSKQLEQ